jgi:hypothetical protein
VITVDQPDAQVTENIVVPDMVEPIVAWRVWLIDPESGYLRSPFFDDVWRPGEPFRARCAALPAALAIRGIRPHKAPHPECGCGTYGVKHPEALEKTLYDIVVHLLSKIEDFSLLDDSPIPTNQRVALKQMVAPYVAIGTVCLWGRVVVCEYGYTAEYAYPERLYTHSRLKPGLLEYGVPCEPVPSWIDEPVFGKGRV